MEIENKTKEWFTYVIFDKLKTYVGSTVNLNKRIRQHNQEIKGGAKYTKGGIWKYYCVIYNINNYKNTCLSEEWHIKYYSIRKVKQCKNIYDRRKKAIEQYYRTRPYISIPYDYIIFINREYAKNYIPIVDNRTFIFIVNDFSMENINNKIKNLKSFTEFILENEKK